MPTYNPTDSRYLVVTQTRTRNGQTDIKIVLDLISNEFYTLDDDGNFILIATGVGTQTLEQVLTQGNTTGDIQILSPDTLSELNVLDGQVSLGCSDGANSSSSIDISESNSNITTTDLITNDYSSLSQTFDETYIDVISGTTQNLINVNQTQVTMVYNDTLVGVNNFIRVKFDVIDLVFDDGVGNQFAFQVDVNGFNPKNLPAYQDDTAAGIAGLPQGYLYQTDGTGAAPLDVAGIMMIKQ
jgi:hypothetical protein